MNQKQQWIEPEHPIFSVREQAVLLELNRSNIYYKPRPKTFSEEQLALLRLVDEIYTQYPYLLADIAITRPFQVFSSDITYIRMHKGFVYLMAILDWYSRFVLDWELSISLEADFCIQTLERVLDSTRCEIFNTDQGAQFTSEGFTNVLKANQIQISMDGKGRWMDNVFTERLWRSVKYECVYLNEWLSVSQARNGLKEYFNFYNYVRPHQSLNGLTPYQVHSSLGDGEKLF